MTLKYCSNTARGGCCRGRSSEPCIITAAAVANKLQSSGFIEGKFGRPIPIIIHDLEYPWYIIEATRKANPGGEADTFLAAMQELGFTE